MFEQEREDGVDFIVKKNHHIYQKWNDFERRYNKARFKFHGHPCVSRTPSGVPYWDYPPFISRYTHEIIVDEQELITSHFNGPRWGKWWRSRNGSVEWGYVDDLWRKPHVEGKSSRKSMRAKKLWWMEAEEALNSHIE